ncbi:hypothetical protein SDC9_184434 [bioreactor metagenome]|uniref:Uncharacterized protein n=1 Tax=bioreactor metagenome TaxID=1076179 RepID=A0A645HEX2_9ZZZZ
MPRGDHSGSHPTQVVCIGLEELIARIFLEHTQEVSCRIAVGRESAELAHIVHLGVEEAGSFNGRVVGLGGEQSQDPVDADDAAVRINVGDHDFVHR